MNWIGFLEAAMMARKRVMPMVGKLEVDQIIQVHVLDVLKQMPDECCQGDNRWRGLSVEEQREKKPRMWVQA